MQDIISIIVLASIGLAVWLLPKYLERRVAEAARGAVDVQVGKTLAEYQFDVDRQLERYRAELGANLERMRQSLSLELERFARDYGLFASKRNEVYAETFALLERARGAYGARFAKIMSHRVFDRSSALDLQHLATRLTDVTEGERRSLVAALESGEIEQARRLAAELYEKNELRIANREFAAFRNACVLNALYFSPIVEELLSEAVRTLAMMSVYADEMIEGEKVSYKDSGPRYSDVESATAKVRSAMRREMQAGVTVTRDTADGSGDDT